MTFPQFLTALATATVFLASLAFAQPAPKPNYPVDAQGKADFNATCLPCRGFAQELRMYQDARTALDQEFDKRTAAIRAMTDAALKGPLTEAQKTQIAADGKALEAIQDRKPLVDAEITRAANTLTECMKKYCTSPAPPPTTGDGLLPPGQPIDPPAGGAGGGTAPPVGGTVPSGGTPPPPGTPVAPPPGAPGAAPAPSGAPCDCERYLREAAAHDAEGRKYEDLYAPAHERAVSIYRQETELRKSLVESNRRDELRTHPLLLKLEAESLAAYRIANDLKVKAEQARKRAQAERDRYLACKDACNKGLTPGPIGVVPGGGPGVTTDTPPPTVPTPTPEGRTPTPGAGAGTPPPATPGGGVDAPPPVDFPPSGPVGPATPAAVRDREVSLAKPDSALNKPVSIVPPIGYGVSDKLEVGAASSSFGCGFFNTPRSLGVYGAFSVNDQDKLDLGPSVNPCLQFPGIGTPVPPAPAPCDCAGLLKLRKEASSKAFEAKYQADIAKFHADNLTKEAIEAKQPVNARDLQALQDKAGRSAAEANQQGDLAKHYQGLYDECIKRCTPPDPPRLVVGLNLNGNNPFSPTNPLGGGTIVVVPPGNPGVPGVLQFSSATYGGAEGGAVLVTVVRSGGRRGPATVSYQTGGGSATAGSDYQPVSGTLAWGDGDDTPKSFSIALTDDTQVEPIETFNVSLNVFTGASAGSPVVAVVSIADNDSTTPAPAGSLQLSSSAYETGEGAGAVTITVNRVNGSSGLVSVQYFTGPGSAVAGSDYQAVSGTLSWLHNDVGAKTFTVPIVDDTLTEPTEGFFVTLNNPTGGATLGIPATASVTIQDNDVSTPVGPCGAVGNAWTPNAGGPYACAGSCVPNPSGPSVTVNGDIVTISNFHTGGPATFQGCGTSLNSQSSNLVYFGQANHRATVNRQGNSAFSASIVSSGGGTCSFTCSR